MGVEWQIGCNSCKRFVWLGSQKAESWEGFQMGNAYVERFFALHRHTSPNQCELYLGNDMHEDGGWTQEGSGWKEDILSRRFWDSYHQKTIRCGSCHKVLSDDYRYPPTENVLRLNRGLYVCDDNCRNAYVSAARTDGESDTYQIAPIYDSSQDDASVPQDSILVVGCTQCKEFAAVDGAMDATLHVRDFKYLAGFLESHVGHKVIKGFFHGTEEENGN